MDRASPTVVRPATPEDAAAAQAIYAPIVAATAISFEYEEPSIEDMERRINAVIGSLPWLVAEVDGAVVGYAYAGITLPNEASVGLHEACGFRRVGVFPVVGYKLGRWHDVGWWHRPLTDPPAHVAPPSRWSPDR